MIRFEFAVALQFLQLQIEQNKGASLINMFIVQARHVLGWSVTLFLH